MSILETPYVLQDQVLYQKNTAEFLDETAAEAALLPLIQYLETNQDIKIGIYSTCAGDADSPDLSDARSLTIKKFLTAAGIGSDRITCLSVPITEDPNYQWGLGYSDESEVNRKTVIMDLNSELLQQLLASSSCATIE